MVRAPCCEKMGLKKGPWAAEEDRILISYIEKHGHGNWRALPKLAGLLRCGKSCRLRWINYLRPDIKRGNFTQEEQDTVVYLHEKLGNRWSAIAAQLPGRTDNEIKNFWHTHLKKRVVNEQSNVYEKKKNDSAIVKAKSKPPQKLDSSNNYEFPSSSLDLSSLTHSPTAVWDGYNEIEKEQHIEVFEAFHQTSGGLWPEEPSTENFNGPIFSSLAFNDEEQVQSPFSAMNSMEFGCYYDNGSQMNDSMEFWHRLLVKAGGSLNNPAF